jgi:glycosyltransferase involved in cell wall biosynthesis
MKKPNIGILTFPISEAGNIPLSNLVDILGGISNDLYIITGNEGYKFFEDDERVHTYGIRHESGKNIITRVTKYICTQLKISYLLARVSRTVDIWIFFIGGQELLIPMLTAKSLRKKKILFVVEYSPKAAHTTGNHFYESLKMLTNINRSLSDRIGIAMKSESIISFFNLQKYRSKIVILGFFLDANLKIKKKVGEREDVVGYVGRLSAEKGVIELARAIPLISSKKNKIRFLIVGNGQLMDEMKNILEKAECLDKVDFVGWTPHKKIPDYLNKMKFHILPSHTEAFGGAAIEAMACGTISIANSVGGIPDVITDGKTGFLLNDNQPQTIANKIIELLDYPEPELDKIQRNASEFVEKTFTYEKATERFESVFSDLLGDDYVKNG